MENLFQIKLDNRQINGISNLALAHIGDGVFDLLCRTYLCCAGDKRVKNLHRDTVQMVKAPAQAKYADKLLPHLTEQEQDWFRRGKNAHSHAAPNSATPQEYAKATGLETLFGALYLLGRKDRLLELFAICMED